MWLHERKWKDNHWVHLHSPSVLVTSHTRSCDDSSAQSKGQNAKKVCECTIETTEIEYWWITRSWIKPGEKESNKQRLRSGHRVSWRRRYTVFRSPSPRTPFSPGLFVSPSFFLLFTTKYVLRDFPVQAHHGSFVSITFRGFYLHSYFYLHTNT